MFAEIKLRILKHKSENLKGKIIQVTESLVNHEINYIEASDYYDKFDKQLTDLEQFADNICAQYRGTEFIVVHRLNKVDKRMSFLQREISKQKHCDVLRVE